MVQDRSIMVVCLKENFYRDLYLDLFNIAICPKSLLMVQDRSIMVVCLKENFYRDLYLDLFNIAICQKALLMARDRSIMVAFERQDSEFCLPSS